MNPSGSYVTFAFAFRPDVNEPYISHLNKGNGCLFLSIGGDLVIADVFICAPLFIFWW